jgi:hypothetical protein
MVRCTGSCEIVQVPTAMQLVALPHETPDTPPGGLFSVRQLAPFHTCASACLAGDWSV